MKQISGVFWYTPVERFGKIMYNKAENGGEMEENSVMGRLLTDAMAELDEDSLRDYVYQAIDEGMSPHDISGYIQKGMEEVGRRFEKREYFVAELIMSGIIFKEILGLDVMQLGETVSREDQGCIVIGTVKEDLHDIGKNIVISLAESAGFKVVDLGVDVSPESFVDAIKEYLPDFVGMSGVMSFAMENMKKTVEIIDREGLHTDLFILAGGATFVNSRGIDTGADHISTDAWETVEYCKKKIKEIRG